MFGLVDFLKQARQLQEHIQSVLNEIEVEVVTGAGLVKVRMDGNRTVTALSIAPELLQPDKQAQLETLLLAALQEAKKRVDAEVQEKIGELLPPGFKLPGF